MNSTTSTPSVDFQFIDAPDSLPQSPPPLQQSQLIYDLSATNSKKNAQFQSTNLARHINTHELITVKNSFMNQQLNEQQFFDDFQAHFVVTLNSSNSSLGSHLSKKKLQKHKQTKFQHNKQNQSPIFNRVSLPQPNDSLKFNFPHLNLNESNQLDSKVVKNKTPQALYCFKKKQQYKKQKTILQHAQSERATKKDILMESTQLPHLQEHQTCKQLKAQFSNTLQGRKNQPCKRYYENHKKKKNMSVKMNELLKKSMQTNQTSLSLEGKNKPVNLSKQMKKSNIFLRLPGIC